MNDRSGKYTDGLPTLMAGMTGIASSEGSDDAITQLIALAGEFAGVSRVYVMQEEPGGRYLRNTYEWVNGDASPAMSSWPLYDLERDIPTLRYTLSGIDPVASHTRDMQPDLKRVLSMQGVQSALLVGMFRGEAWVGLVGFSQCDREREWSDDEKALLSHLCYLVKLFLERRECLYAIEQLDVVREALDRYALSSPNTAHRHGRASRTPRASTTEPLPDESPEDLGRETLIEALTLFGGNKSMAARHLGLTWDTFNRRCRKYELNTREYAKRDNGKR